MVAQIESQQQYEQATQAIARELLAETREKRSLWNKLSDNFRLDDKLLDWAMAHPGLRVQLFKFIDCLPALQSNTEIAHHLQQYMGEEDVELPEALKKLLNFADAQSPPAQLAAATISKATETLAFKYIAGETIAQVIKAVEKLRKEKMGFTIDLLGEAVITETEASAYWQNYLDLMAQLSQQAKSWSTVPQIDQADGEMLPQVQVSVKLTAFYSQFDPLDPEGSKAKVCERIRELLRQAKELNVAVHFDMEQYHYKNLILNILKELLVEEEFRSRTDVGITMQAYLRDSAEDLEDLIPWAKHRGYPVTVRLVKGAYWDQETIKAQQNHWSIPVYVEKAQTDANYERMTRLLLENHEYLYAAIGSHNVRSQALACAIAEELNIPKRRYEMQILYGMGEPLARAIVKRGHRVRVYAPYGKLLPGMAYLIRRLLENTANSSFLRQNLEERPVEELIGAPQVKGVNELPNKGYPNAPDTDYADADLRQKAFQSLTRVKQQLSKTYLPYINGEYVQTETIIESVNPCRPSEIIGKVGLINIEQADHAIEMAKEAFPGWKKTPVRERCGILRKAADIMESRRHELNAWICLEVGKIIPQADAEVSEAIDFCRYYADEMERLDQGVNLDIPGETNRYLYQPRGIALVISPWNFPMAIAVGMTVAALVAGNCTLLKPAETSTVIAAKITEILIEAGVPKGVFQFIPGKGSVVGSHLVNHPDVHLIAFTGSREVGCRIYADAALVQPGQKHLKRVIAEMGGKNAIIVDESADLDQAVAGAVYSAFGYTGQKCSACSRIVVLAPVHDAFVERFVEATRSLNIGDTDHPSTQVGPVIDGKAQARIKEYIEQGKAECELAIEREAPTEGYFVGPTVFKNVSPHATIAQEEIFGPVVAIIRASNFDEALEVANGTDYALTGGLYSRTPEHIDQAAKEFEVGNLYINRTITGAIVSRQPFGGFKMSGVGSKAGGPDYLLQFLEPRHVTENIQRQGFAPIEGADQ
ncbi:MULTISPECIES: L-glutamate gamma-semialdehyde dehydrogenase [unclassified Synechocystis]|uniref:L-glutamate gamma-semialdehyde dehydrogenase n=1 Tax=unclassified Synechocystis TaxID=2640012 RepID=UPI000406ED1F|nr:MULTISPECIES: L-glutamate gamma-semialdehyde dehydrogenase [unclassified Synechocystis]AIE72882.1 Proline dehydrogenase (Proline oxidase) / Delta-1-pyrroline-5-carboxylate dehydrogenase [Synechocystis sp. PCC 6714]MCT0252634.1 L-glutamate gamma-semialdehyde dehydrogenase [Synechocystis sp. CS-94]